MKTIERQIEARKKFLTGTIHSCIFCGDIDFDIIGLAHHIKNYCPYINDITPTMDIENYTGYIGDWIKEPPKTQEKG